MTRRSACACGWPRHLNEARRAGGTCCLRADATLCGPRLDPDRGRARSLSGRRQTGQFSTGRCRCRLKLHFHRPRGDFRTVPSRAPPAQEVSGMSQRPPAACGKQSMPALRGRLCSTARVLFDRAGVIDAKNPNVVWVGTGENNSQRSVSYGRWCLSLGRRRQILEGMSSCDF